MSVNGKVSTTTLYDKFRHLPTGGFLLMEGSPSSQNDTKFDDDRFFRNVKVSTEEMENSYGPEALSFYALLLGFQAMIVRPLGYGVAYDKDFLNQRFLAMHPELENKAVIFLRRRPGWCTVTIPMVLSNDLKTPCLVPDTNNAKVSWVKRGRLSTPPKEIIEKIRELDSRAFKNTGWFVEFSGAFVIQCQDQNGKICLNIYTRGEKIPE